MKHAVIITLLLTTFIPLKIYPCSAFTYIKDGHIILAANSDDCQRLDGLIIINKRNVSKRGDTPGMSGKYAIWISKYGSITFTYCCREIAQYGMNETGLTISTVGLPGSRGPDADNRPPLAGNIWAQYLLDNCSTIEEVINVESTIRLVDDKDQYLICDRNGKTLIVQCQDGKVLYYFNKSLPIPVLTNEKYAECLLNYHKNFIPTNDPNSSNKRFQTGSREISNKFGLDNDQAVDNSFDVLDKISQHPCTQWNIVFDIKNKIVYYRTKYSHNIRNFKLDDFDFSCNTKMLELDVTNKYTGNVSKHFKEYSRKNNIDLMRKTFKHFGIERTEKQLLGIIDFFESFKCRD